MRSGEEILDNGSGGTYRIYMQNFSPLVEVEFRNFDGYLAVSGELDYDVPQILQRAEAEWL